MKAKFTSLVLLLMLLLGGGCALPQASRTKITLPTSLSTQASRNFNPLKVNQVVIYPFEGRKVEQSPVKSSELFTNAFTEHLEVGTSLELLNKRVEDAGISSAGNRFGGRPLLERAAELGQKLGAQGVFCGVVNIFSQSDGAKYGASKPASVAFRVWLVDPQTSEVLWTAAYQRTEHPLSDNLLELPRALKQGIKYRSAPTLLKEGFAEVAKALENLRAPQVLN